MKDETAMKGEGLEEAELLSQKLKAALLRLFQLVCFVRHHSYERH